MTTWTCNWLLKLGESGVGGQSCRTEPLTCGIWCCSGSVVSELSWIDWIMKVDWLPMSRLWGEPGGWGERWVLVDYLLAEKAIIRRKRNTISSIWMNHWFYLFYEPWPISRSCLDSLVGEECRDWFAGSDGVKIGWLLRCHIFDILIYP